MEYNNNNQQQRIKMQQQQEEEEAIIKMQQQQAALLQHHSLYHPSLLHPPPLIEPIPSGNLPPGFDPSTCRSVYAGNIHTQVTEILLQEVFSSTGLVESCKLIRKEKSSYGFIHYFDRRSAALAILSLNGRKLFGQPIKVNWAYANSHRVDTSSHFNIFVGDLSSEVTDAMLFACFSVYPSCSDARVMWDQKTGRSRGFGFVSFRNQQDAQSAINELTGKWLGSRQIRCNWATKGAAGTSEDMQSSEGKSMVEVTNASSGASLQRQGKFKEAIKYHSMVLEMSDREGETLGNTEAYGAIADCFTEIGELEQDGKFYVYFSATIRLMSCVNELHSYVLFIGFSFIPVSYLPRLSERLLDN